jgi:hypothetical protein
MQVAAFGLDSLLGVILYFERRSVELWAMDALNFFFAFDPRGDTLGGTP